MQYKEVIVYPCANGSLVSASYQNGSIIIFDKSGLAMGHIDAVPVVHGRWERRSDSNGFLCCSRCHDVFIEDEWLDDGKWSYCPNCGAKMDLEDNKCD